MYRSKKVLRRCYNRKNHIKNKEYRTDKMIYIFPVPGKDLWTGILVCIDCAPEFRALQKEQGLFIELVPSTLSEGVSYV